MLVKGDFMELSKNIYNLRKKNVFSQEYLAEKLNVSRQTISNWELGETSPNPEQLLLLSKTLEVSTDNLLGNDIIGIKLDDKTYSSVQAKVYGR